MQIQNKLEKTTSMSKMMKKVKENPEVIMNELESNFLKKNKQNIGK